MSLPEVGVKLVADGQDTFVAALDRAKDAVNTLTESAKSGFGFSEATTAADTLATAIGVGLYDAVKEAAGWMYDLGKQAFDTVADFERTTQSITAMIGIEKSMGTTVENVSKGIRELTKKEIKSLDDKKYKLQQNAVEQGKIHANLKKLLEADTEGKGNAEIDERTTALQRSQAAAQLLGEEIAELQGLAGQEFDIITKEQVGTIDDMKEAFRLAKPEADAILDSLTRLALVSPFERAPILQTMKQAQAFGFTSKEAMSMTEVFLKFATVTGRTQGHIGRLGYAMGQMKSQGKVMTRQLRQMNMAGLGMDQMAQAMGMSIIDFTSAVSKGKIPFDEFNDNLTKFIDAKYTPAFEEINESFYGLQNAFKDISKLSLAAFTEGTFEAGKNILVNFVRPFTQGEALAAIQGFGDKIGGALAPGLQKVADFVKDVMDGFIKLSDLINGGKINKEDKANKTNAKELGVIQTELGAALEKTAKGGMSSTRAFTDATASYQYATGATEDLKASGILLSAELTKSKADVSGLTILYKDQETKLSNLTKAGKTGSEEFKKLTDAHTATSATLATAKGLVDSTTVSVKKNTDDVTANTTAIKTSKAEVDKLTKAHQNLSPEYVALSDSKKLLEANNKKETKSYEDIVARMTEMEDATTNYVDNSMSLKDTAVVAKELADKIEAAKDKGKEMRDGFNPGGANQTTFLDKLLESYKEFIPANSPIVDILKTLEQLFHRIKIKVDHAIDSVFKFGKTGGKSGATKILEGLADALHWVVTNFEKIWHIGENVVTTLVGLAVFNRIATYVSLAASALGLFLSPLGLIVGAVAGVTLAYDNNNESVKNFVDNSGVLLDTWWGRTKKIFDKNTTEGKVFKANWTQAFDGIKGVFSTGFLNQGTVDKSLDYMNAIDDVGFTKIRTGISRIFEQFGLFPKTAETIANLLVSPIQKIVEIFNGITVAIKAGVIDKIVEFWRAKPGTKEAQDAADAIKNILLNLVPAGWQWVAVTGLELITDALGVVKWAWEGLESIWKKLTTGGGGEQINTFLNMHKDKLATAIEWVVGLTVAVGALNAAFVQISGVSLANLATGIAPENVQGIANMRGRGKGGGGGGGASMMSAFKKGGKFAAPDLDALAAARKQMGLLGEASKIAADDFARLSLKGVDLFDVAGYEEALGMMGGAEGKNADVLKQMREQFQLTGEQAAAATLQHEAALASLQGTVDTTGTKMKALGTTIADAEKRGGNIFQRMAFHTKESLGQSIKSVRDWQTGVEESVSSTAKNIYTKSLKMFDDSWGWIKMKAGAAWGWVQINSIWAYGMAKTKALQVYNWAIDFLFDEEGWMRKKNTALVGWATLKAEQLAAYLDSAMTRSAAWATEIATDTAAWVKKNWVWATYIMGLNSQTKVFWLQAYITNKAGWVATHVGDAYGWVETNAIWLAGNYQRLAGVAWTWVTTRAINAAEWVKTQALAIWQGGMELARQHWQKAKEIAIDVEKWLWKIAVAAWGIAVMIFTNTTGAIGMLAPLWAYAVTATLALIGPWGIAILIIALLIYAIIFNVEGFRDKIVEVLQAVMTFLTDIVMTVVQSVIDIATNLYNTWKDTLVTFFYEAVIPAVEAVADMFGDLLDGVQWVINIFDSLWQLFKMYILPVLEGALTIAIDLVITYFMALFTVIFGVIRIVWTIISTFVSLVYQFLEAIGVIDWIKKVFRDLSAWGSGPEFQQFIDTVVSGFSWITGGLWEMIKFINGGIEGFEKLGRAARNQRLLTDIDEYIEDPAAKYWHLDPANYGKTKPDNLKIKNPNYQKAISEILESEQRRSQQKLFEQVQITREKNEYKAIASAYDPYNLSQKAKDNDKGGGFMDGFMSMFGAGGGAGVAAKLGFGAPALPAGMTKEQMAGGPPPSIFGDSGDPRGYSTGSAGSAGSTAPRPKAYGEDADLTNLAYLGKGAAGYADFQSDVSIFNAGMGTFFKKSALQAQEDARIATGRAIEQAATDRALKALTAARIAGLGGGAFYNRGSGNYSGTANVITNIDARGADNVPVIVASVTSAAGVAGKILNNAVGKAYAGATP